MHPLNVAWGIIIIIINRRSGITSHTSHAWGMLEVYGHWLSLYTSGVLIDYLLPINSATNSHF